MGIKKKYTGYKSFDYLERDVDYRAFKPAKETDWVEPYLVPLSASEEERVIRLVTENPVVSAHDHVTVLPEDVTKIRDYLRRGRRVTAFEGLSKSCLDCVFENMLTVAKWDDVLHELGMRLCDIGHQDSVIIAHKVDDILRAHKEAKVALVLSIEGATSIEDELSRIDVLYGLGLRAMGLVYSESNALGTGLREDRDGGLTDFGRRCVERMNKLGMSIDVAHCSDLTILDAVEASKKPILATHIGARALWDIKRLKPDNVLKAIADKGGVIGIEAAPHTTLTKQHLEHDIESVMEHFEYIKNLVGIDHIAFGPDTMYGDHVAFHYALGASLSMDKAFGKTMREVPYVKGMENPTECSWNVIRWLVKHDYSDANIAKVIGGNIISVLQQVWY